LRPPPRRSAALQLCLALPLLLAAAPRAVAAGAASPADPLRAGERIYREGILPSGKPLRATLAGGHAVPGVTFACAGCHRRSGLGALEDGVLTPAVTGAKLFKPLPRLFKGIEQAGAPLRPAYDEALLLRAIRTGVDAGGRTLGDGMPRFPLDDADAALLVAYLESLSAAPSPGVVLTEAGGTLRFATVVSEDVRPELRDAMVSTLAANFDLNRNQVRVLGSRRYDRTRLMAERMLESRDLAKMELQLATWVLKGPPETWPAQLDAYDRAAPAFALVGGMVTGDWRPVHRFCDERRVPCLFPNTELPVVAGGEGYTVYLSRGFRQEGDAAARFLAGKVRGGPVLQLVRDTPEAAALAAGFDAAWSEQGRKPAVTVALPAGKRLDKAALGKLLARERPAALVLWEEGAAAVEALAAIPAGGGRGPRPQAILLSGRYLGDEVWKVADGLRDATWITWPWSFTPWVPRAPMGSQAAAIAARKPLREGQLPLHDPVERMTALTGALTQLLAAMLMEMKGDFVRDYFLDVAGMMTDQPWPLYGRISLMGDQRFAVRSCSVVQLSRGANPELVEKGGRYGD
jgi:mono/diheme cytochrome c family protein